MSIPTTLLAIETALRRTVSEAEFRQTPDLLQRYMQELYQEAHRVPPGGVEVQDLAVRAAALLDWIRTMASVSLAHDAAELQHLPVLVSFGNPEPRQPQAAVDA